MLKYLFILVTTIAAEGFFTSSALAATDDPSIQCAGSTGAAYGLCVAASHLGCGTEDEENTRACERIEENYLKLTGNTPPWLEYCPCWTTAILQSQGEFEVCGQNFPEVPGSTVFAYVVQGDQFGITGPAGGNSDLLICGVHTDELGLIFVSPITQEEHESCARQVMVLCPNPTN